MTSSDVPKAFHVMAKPTGSACNLNCDYCFFLKKERLYPGSNFRMADEVLDGAGFLSAIRGVSEKVPKTRHPD